MHCRICNNATDNASYVAREMQLGMGESFEYVQCSACGCLQIAEIPVDMTPYYPPRYFEGIRLGGVAIPAWAATMWPIAEILRVSRRLAPVASTGDGLVVALAAKAIEAYLPECAGRFDLRILDVGCGSGSLIRALGQLGFTRLSGIDKFADPENGPDEGVRVRKGTIRDVEPPWDVVMMHHSLEHMAEPHETLGDVARVLSPGGVALIRVPVASSHAWEQYGVNWVQLDAPRHFFLHSVQSLERVARRAGLRLVRHFHDSTGEALIGSEMYQRGGRLGTTDPRDYFSFRELLAFGEQSISLNREGRGDQAAFYFEKAD